jgi:hypothetical protein
VGPFPALGANADKMNFNTLGRLASVAVLELAILHAMGSMPARAQTKAAPRSVAVPRALDGKVDLSGVWIVSGSTLLPSDPSYQPAAQKLYDQRKANRGKDDPEKDCLPNGAVRITSLPYKIVQTPKLVVMLSEGNTHSYRRFFVDGRPHNLEVEPTSWNGDSIAHWDGDALVVDTIGVNDKSWLDSTGKPHSEALHLIERYRRPDLGHMQIEYTLEDPMAFTKPYRFTRTFTLIEDRDLKEYFCAGDRFTTR